MNSSVPVLLLALAAFYPIPRRTNRSIWTKKTLMMIVSITLVHRPSSRTSHKRLCKCKLKRLAQDPFVLTIRTTSASASTLLPRLRPVPQTSHQRSLLRQSSVFLRMTPRRLSSALCEDKVSGRQQARSLVRRRLLRSLCIYIRSGRRTIALQNVGAVRRDLRSISERCVLQYLGRVDCQLSP